MFSLICWRVAYKTHDSMSKVKVTLEVKKCNLYLVSTITSPSYCCILMILGRNAHSDIKVCHVQDPSLFFKDQGHIWVKDHNFVIYILSALFFTSYCCILIILGRNGHTVKWACDVQYLLLYVKGQGHT